MRLHVGDEEGTGDFLVSPAHRAGLYRDKRGTEVKNTFFYYEISEVSAERSYER